MEKDCGEIKITETEDGFRIDVMRKPTKDSPSGCSRPVFAIGQPCAPSCCSPAEPDKDPNEK